MLPKQELVIYDFFFKWKSRVFFNAEILTFGEMGSSLVVAPDDDRGFYCGDMFP